MDRNTYKYVSTKLKKVFLEEINFGKKLTFSLKIRYVVKEATDENDLTLIKVSGDLTVKNDQDDIAANIIMESYFETEDDVDEDELEELDDYLHTPVINEITLLLGQLTGKALKVPVFIPFEVDENEVQDN